MRRHLGPGVGRGRGVGVWSKRIKGVGAFRVLRFARSARQVRFFTQKRGSMSNFAIFHLNRRLPALARAAFAQLGRTKGFGVRSVDKADDSEQGLAACRVMAMRPRAFGPGYLSGCLSASASCLRIAK